MGTLQLGVNVDHIATLRQVRYATTPDSKNAEPDPVVAASLCERAGASGITAHLRTDRRHVQERDLKRLRANIMTKLNLEMGNTPELIDFALLLQPDEVCLVPEKRQEITTEGGLDLVRHERELGPTMKRLHAAGIRVSLFIDPAPEQVDAAVRLGSDIVELHTGGLGEFLHRKGRATGTRTAARRGSSRRKFRPASKCRARHQLPQYPSGQSHPASH